MARASQGRPARSVQQPRTATQSPPASVESFAVLLENAVNDPGIISAAYRQFHSYSMGNQLLAWQQCLTRGLPPGPLATYPRWKALGRHVRKGERAISLSMPVTIKRPRQGENDAADDPQVFTRFIYRPHWFVLAQTDGPDVPPVPVPGWDPDTALGALHVTEVPFDSGDGNVMGFARGRSIAISPLNPLPHKTRFHELAHVLLGHTGRTRAARRRADAP